MHSGDKMILLNEQMDRKKKESILLSCHRVNAHFVLFWGHISKEFLSHAVSLTVRRRALGSALIYWQSEGGGAP